MERDESRSPLLPGGGSVTNGTVYERDIVDITVEEILAMEAGPELDYLVARYMSAEIRSPVIVDDDSFRFVEGERVKDSVPRSYTNLDAGEIWPWNPSQDANDALVVWRALPNQDTGEYWVWWQIDRRYDGAVTIGVKRFAEMPVYIIDTPLDFCTAVCRAYLWAVKRGWGMVMATLKERGG